jgi:hypothetical protein
MLVQNVFSYLMCYLMSNKNFVFLVVLTVLESLLNISKLFVLLVLN